MRDRSEVDPDGRGGAEELGGCRGKENHNQVIYVYTHIHVNRVHIFIK